MSYGLNVEMHKQVSKYVSYHSQYDIGWLKRVVTVPNYPSPSNYRKHKPQ